VGVSHTEVRLYRMTALASAVKDPPKIYIAGQYGIAGGNQFWPHILLVIVFSYIIYVNTVMIRVQKPRDDMSSSS
jgi:hypothetical protein